MAKSNEIVRLDQLHVELNPESIDLKEMALEKHPNWTVRDAEIIEQRVRHDTLEYEYAVQYDWTWDRWKRKAGRKRRAAALGAVEARLVNRI